jgi:corrinoid protein of di/trimethylamine methyltransferase
MPEIFENIAMSVYSGEVEKVSQLAQEALDGGAKAVEVLQGGLIAGMDAVGRDFKVGELFVPDVLLSAKAMKSAMEVLRPHLTEAEASMRGKYVLGTVQGDLHDVGKNLVGIMLQGAGFDVVDLGKDVSPETFVEAVKEHGAKILGMSALLTTTMLKMRSTIEALEEAGIRDSVKVMIGGAPVTPQFAEEIGADVYAPDAGTAASIAQDLVG